MINKLSVSISCMGDLVVFVWFQFDVVDDGINRYVREWYCVVWFDVCFCRCDDLIVNCQMLRCQDVGLFVIFIFDECDECGLVWVVFDLFYSCCDIKFVLFEINDLVQMFCVIVMMMRSDLFGVVLVV